MTLHSLVPPDDDGPLPPSLGSRGGLISELGYRPDESVDAALAGVGLVPVFQPVVSLPDKLVVGFEALARWPMAPTMAAPRVFSLASATRQSEPLDHQCIDAAARAALDSDLPQDSLLLINTEPSAAHSPRATHPALNDACDRFQVVFELTERELLAHPQALLDKVTAIRGDGIAVAIDDVGAHQDSLAVLDILDPDIVKLDMTMIQSTGQRDKANALTGILAHHERTGARIIAEGVETDEDLEQALAMGASLAQGFRFGRGRPLGLQQRAGGPPPAVARVERRGGGSAHAAYDDGRKPLRVARQHVVASLVRHIEEQARNSIDHPIVLAAWQRAQNFPSGARDLYRQLAANSPLVAVLGTDMPADLGGGVRGVDLRRDDPLCQEWVVVTLGADTCRAVVARQLRSPAGPDSERRFEFLVTSDRAMVTKAARSMLARVE